MIWLFKNIFFLDVFSKKRWEPKSTRNVTVKLCYLMVHGLLEFRLSIKESLEWKHKEKIKSNQIKS